MTEIAGLPVRTEPENLMTPLSAVAVIRGLNTDGKITCWQIATEDVSIVDAIGMHEAAAFRYKNRLVQ